MRVIDFLQLISDLDKQTLFYYEDDNKQNFSITNLEVTAEQIYLITKKAERHTLHQWELVTLLNQVKNKNRRY